VALRIKNYLALREALTALLSRPVDLIEDGAIRNPYILQKVSEQQQVLYAA
jgi:predicted nucleotidyltransferase